MKNTKRPAYSPFRILSDETNAQLREMHERACDYCEKGMEGDYSFVSAYLIGAMAAALDKANSARK